MERTVMRTEMERTVMERTVMERTIMDRTMLKRSRPGKAEKTEKPLCYHVEGRQTGRSAVIEMRCPSGAPKLPRNAVNYARAFAYQ